MKKICVICKKEFGCYNKKIGGGRAISLRPHKSKTCSKECSKIYNRAVQSRKFFVSKETIFEEINFLKELLETESFVLDNKIKIRIKQLEKLIK